jgi:mRNA interferase HigB
MRIITKTRIKNAMFEYPQWKAGLELWCQVFEQKSLKAGSYNLLKKTWKEASGWNTDRIPGRRLKNEQGDYGTVFDLYVFDVHGTDCRILAKLGSGTLFVRGVFSHAEYDKWCKQNIHQGKLKR